MNFSFISAKQHDNTRQNYVCENEMLNDITEFTKRK